MESWNKFKKTGKIVDYLAYKREKNIGVKNESSKNGGNNSKDDSLSRK